MSKKKDYIEQVQKTIKKYKDKVSKVDNILSKYNLSNNSELLDYRENLQDKFNQAENIIKKIKASGKEEYEQIKEEASEIFELVKEAFQELSWFLIMDQLNRTKSEIVDFGSNKIDEAEELLKQHPLAAAVSALSLGFIIGSLFTRFK